MPKKYKLIPSPGTDNPIPYFMKALYSSDSIVSWLGRLYMPSHLSYSFTLPSASWQSKKYVSNIRVLTAEEKAIVRESCVAWSEIAKVVFEEDDINYDFSVFY